MATGSKTTTNLRTLGALALKFSPYLLILAVLTIVPIVLSNLYGEQFLQFPFDWGRDFGLQIDNLVDWATESFSGFFQSFKNVILIFLTSIKTGLLWIPWPALIGAIIILSIKIAGVRIAIFSFISLVFMGFMGLWTSTVETISLVIVTVSLSMFVGVPFGLLAGRSNRVDRLLRPILDGMQTMPSYVYLVPAIAFFSVGDVPAVIATVIYAVPPVIRLTNLGIRQVSHDTVEAARSMGATSLQVLFKVQIPLALPTIMAGVNQTTLLALSMVVIAALVGAGGLGEDVFRALGRIEPGNAFIAGTGIVFLAIIVDRITQAYSKKRQVPLASPL